MTDVGLALWSMQRTQAVPSPGWPQLYADLIDDSRAAEDLGFDSLWLAEHRFWYDGWCPQPLIAAALSKQPRVRHLKIEDGPGQALGRSFRVKLWPTLVRMRNGAEIARAVRPLRADDIGALFNAPVQLSAPHAAG